MRSQQAPRLPIPLLLLLFSLATAQTASSQTELLVLEGGTVFQSPDTAPLDSAVVVIGNGKIIAVSGRGEIAIPSDAARIDVTGKFIAAGFWNSHVHYLFSADLHVQDNLPTVQTFLDDMLLRWGFVNTVDTGSDFRITQQIQHLIESGKVRGPGILTMGGSFVPKGGSPFYIKPVMLPEFTSNQQAGEQVHQALQQGLDGIKLFTGSWATESRVVLMQDDHIRAATDMAHKSGALVFAHPSDSDGARIAIENGVDVLAHTFPAELKGSWDRSLPATMAEHGVSLIPTLKLFRFDLERIGLPARLVDRLERNAIDQAAAAKRAGVMILFGTDVGYMDDPDTTEEYRLMQLAGLDYRDILASLTTAPAKRYQLDDRQGQIAPGFNADVVVMATDPREQVTAFADVLMTIRNGRIIFER